MVQSQHIRQRVRESKTYAQNLYAALCNTEWQEQDAWQILTDQTWSCSWRTAGGIVADIQGEGDYMDWYCSGMMTGHPNDDLAKTDLNQYGAVPEGTVTDEIREDLLSIGWRQVVDR